MLFLQALEVEYDEHSDADEIELILANPHLVEKLEEGRNSMQDGKGEKVDLNNLWK